MRKRSALALVAFLALAPRQRAERTDAVDELIRKEMEKRQVPGLSLAVIQDGQIVKAQGYGVVEKGAKARVTPSTLFQAGSISKPVAALGALHLVESDRLALDEDVNARLTSWKVPDNDFTRDKKVTLRGLLSHTAGLTVHGFPGYAVTGPVPALVQILDGQKPANTAAIRVERVPGSRWSYSGGGYTVLQQMILDVTGKPFPEFMRETVLAPLEMTRSSYEQPLPAARAKETARGHFQDRSFVEGRWHLYPEMAAAGLWTTPSDLARFAIEVQQSLAGKSNKVISREMARQMLTDQMANDGLGVFLQGKGRSLRFSHGGRDEGFDAMLTAYAETGQGAVVMINANDNSGMVRRIIDFVAREYRWPDAPPAPRPVAPVPTSAAALDALSGRYELENNRMVTFAAGDGVLFTRVDGFQDEEFLPTAPNRFSSRESDVEVTFYRDKKEEVTGLRWKENGRERGVARIGPLVHSIQPQADPDPERTRKVERVLRALGKGEAAKVSSLLTAGALRDFGSGPISEVAPIRSLQFLAAHDVAARNIDRHGDKVARIVYYRLGLDKGRRYVLVHLTRDGTVTDFDLVDD